MKRLLQLGCLAAALLSATGPLRAQDVVCKGPVDACARATDQLQLFLAILDSRAPAERDWRWVLLDADGWARITETFRSEATLAKITGSAFSVAAIRTVYVNLSYFLKVLPSEALRTTMHELAHITRCGKDEACAIRETKQRLRALGVKP
jgi:hypothetical protein